MIMADGTPKVIEFNCRLGDPETQAVLMRLQSDLPQLCLAALRGSLAGESAQWDSRAALGVVLAAAGYPASYPKGMTVHGLGGAASDTQKVFHAGTTHDGEKVITDGGRVLCVVGLGDSVAAAADSAYEAADKISWDGMFSRRDIGYKAIAREQG
jgi:phosphoribosylamine--glycine ligase